MTSMIRLTPQAQAPGAAGRAVQGVERALLAAARHALAAHRERVVADDGGAGGLDGGGVRAEAAEDDHGGKGPEPLGRSTPAEKLALRPLCETFTVMPVPETVPVTLDGLPGFSCGFQRWRSPELSLPEGVGDQSENRFETCQRTAETFDTVPGQDPL